MTNQFSLPRRLRGFTLIEIMITVAIIGILSAIAIPSYRDYVTRGRIPQATNNLSALRVKMEQYFQDNRTYVGACVANTVAELPPADDFTYTCPTLTATTYTLTATGGTRMSGFTYSINQLNTRSSVVPTRWGTGGNCWITKKGDTC
jgi:type IV pilus assembly protein PilE